MLVCDFRGRRPADGERLDALELVGHLACDRCWLAVGRRVEAGRLRRQVSHGRRHTFPRPRLAPDCAAAPPHTAASATDDSLPRLRRRTGDDYISREG